MTTEQWIVFVHKADGSMDYHAVSTDEGEVSSCNEVAQTFVSAYHDRIPDGARVAASEAQLIYDDLTEGGFHDMVKEMKAEFDKPGVPFGDDDNPLE